MIKSLQTKLVLILVLLIVSVMAVVGAFLINSVTAYNISEFQTQMTRVFTTEFLSNLESNAEKNQSATSLKEMLMAYSGTLGLDEYRNLYILDGKTGAYLAGSNDTQGQDQELTPNMIKAMSGKVGQKVTGFSSYFDVAIPVRAGEQSYVVTVVDTKQELNELTWNLFTILVRAMMFGLAVAVMLSFILAKTITNPVQNLTKMARSIADGDFSQRPQAGSEDEIGILTKTFADMAQVLEKTLAEVNGERNKLNTLFTHMADGVAAFDKTGALLQINPAAMKMLGIAFDPKLTYGKIFPNLDINESDLGEDGKYIEVDYAANRRILKIFLAMFGTAQDEYSGIMAVLHDVTEQAKLDSSRREFVANVSHELRTPLTNVKGYTETLLDAGDEIDAETRTGFLKVVYNEADRMTHIVKDLLTLSQLDYGRMELKKEELPLSMLVSNVVNAMMIEAKKQKIELTADLSQKTDCVMGDRAKLEQVLVNIVANAVKYNKVGGTVHVSLRQEGKKVLVEVKDTGMGIPEEDVPRLFERFYRVDKARSREKGGTGLGLAIAKEIIEYHHGSIQVESVFEKGTTMTICLPAAEHEEQA